MEKSKIRTFAKLGYSQLDTAEIVVRLNSVLATYNVYAQKLRNFHWNAIGQDFFDLHEKFGMMYRVAEEHIDEIAEKIRLFGQNPYSTLKEYINHSSIKEPVEKVSSIEMAKTILNDIRILLSLMEECIHVSEDLSDFATENMMKSFIRTIEKDHWMLTAWLNEPIVKR